MFKVKSKTQQAFEEIEEIEIEEEEEYEFNENLNGKEEGFLYLLAMK